jgi:hypothetical protein
MALYPLQTLPSLTSVKRTASVALDRIPYDHRPLKLGLDIDRESAFLGCSALLGIAGIAVYGHSHRTERAMAETLSRFVPTAEHPAISDDPDS